MSDDLLLAIDQGTHSSRAILFDTAGRQQALAREAVDLDRRSHSEVEQSAEQILASVRNVIRKVLEDPVTRNRHIAAAGLATQRSSVLAWNRATGQALSPLLSWQDTRTRDAIRSLGLDEAQLSRTTGLRLSAHYGAGKLRWLLDNLPAAKNGYQETLAMGPLASYLLNNLLDGHPMLVDHANASRMLLWNLDSRDWDENLAAQFDIPLALLPACRPTSTLFGTLAGSTIPLTAVNGDQTAALYALGKPRDDTLAINIGTGAFVLAPTADASKRPQGLLAGIAQSTADTASYFVEGTVNGAAAALQWLEAQQGSGSMPLELGRWLDEVRDPPLFINTVGGLGAPWWTPGPAPRFTDAEPGLPQAAVAVCESIVFLLQAIIARMPENMRRIRVSGGLSRLDGLCRKLASLSGRAVERPLIVEATARGIAWQASGLRENWAAEEPPTVFEPKTDTALASRYQRFIATLEELAG